MFTRLFSATPMGVDGREVEIEVNEGRGDPLIVIVGLPDAAVRESRDRVVAAIANSGFRRPRGRTTINLAPADLRKEGPGFDLPIALGMIALSEEAPIEAFANACIVGELALDGALRPVRGILPIALEARARGKRQLILPSACADEASVVKSLDVIPVDNLREAFEFLVGDRSLSPLPHRSPTELRGEEAEGAIDLADVKGQEHVKRALEVAAAGGHNMLMIGPPGTGKSMLAKRIPTIMPGMSEEEAIETTKIHSIAGFLKDGSPFVSTRPFRSPHHTISDVGLLGGGSNPGPGEVSLAHHGVLFADELPEFRRSTLEVLRQPLEDGDVTISRAAGKMTFPARFMLVAAMNPCPCGYFGDAKRECRCGTKQVANYRQRISGPLLDRIDLHVEVPLIDFRALSSAAPGESSATVRKRVEDARQGQQARYAEHPSVNANSGMTPKLQKVHCALDAESAGLLEQAMDQMDLSARAHDRILKVARTIADLASCEAIGPDHILEAISYRTLDRSLW